MYTTQKFNKSLSLQYKLDNLTGRTFNLLASGEKFVGGVTCRCGSPQAYFMSVVLCYISLSYPDIGCLVEVLSH